MSLEAQCSEISGSWVLNQVETHRKKKAADQDNKRQGLTDFPGLRTPQKDSRWQIQEGEKVAQGGSHSGN